MRNNLDSWIIAHYSKERVVGAVILLILSTLLIPYLSSVEGNAVQFHGEEATFLTDTVKLSKLAVMSMYLSVLLFWMLYVLKQWSTVPFVVVAGAVFTLATALPILIFLNISVMFWGMFICLSILLVGKLAMAIFFVFFLSLSASFSLAAGIEEIVISSVMFYLVAIWATAYLMNRV